ncbi:MAG: anaerobic sulfatase maturase [Prolixibacteraceae bacterium]
MDDFQIFVKPVGARCNLACSYCYYLEKHGTYREETNLRMTDEVLDEYIRQHISLSSGPEIFFSWHGGEPTLAGMRFFQRVVQLQQKHAGPNCRIINGIQTNGTLLTPDWCRFLKHHHFIVGISLDGPENFHSDHRFHRGGKSCFEEVLRGYHLLKQFEIPCEILCVVSAENVKYPLEIYRFFKQLRAEYITFLPLVEKQSPSGTMVSERSVPAAAFGQFLCAIFDEWKANDIGAIKIQIFEEALRSAFHLEHSLCIFKKTCGRVPVIEYNGDFYSCDHYVNKENLIGNILSSQLELLLENQAQQAFGRNKEDLLPEYCKKCEVLELCNGACPKDRLIETPDGEPGLNYLCEGYRYFFNHCKPFIEQVAEAWKS